MQFENDGSGGTVKLAGSRATRLGEHGGSGGTVTPAGSRATRLGEHDGSGGRVKLEGSNSEREQQAGAAQIQAAMRIARGLLCEGKGSVIIDDRA